MQNQKQKNILFIDNDKELIHNLEDYLVYHEIKEKYGLNFIFAIDVKEALNKVSEMQIDLIVLEILMPIISGYYFLNTIKKEKNKIPVIVYTKLKSENDLDKMAASGADNIFVKQLTKIDTLVQEIVEYDAKSMNLNNNIKKLKDELQSISEDEANTQLKVIQCPRCHVVLAPKSHFCNNCGQKIFKLDKISGKEIIPSE